MIKNLTSLKNKFRAAAFSGLAALGLITGCSRAPDTKLVIDSTNAYARTFDFCEWSIWHKRQDYYLKNDRNKTRYQTWLAQLDGTKNLSLAEKAKKVDEIVNESVTYASDDSTYGRHEYCASGIETILKGVGDCEDHAIAMFYAMKYLGVPDSRFTLLYVATDTVLDNTVHAGNHTVLAVDTSAANDWANCLVLENHRKPIASLETLGKTGYKPFMIYNERTIRSCTMTTKTPSP